MPNERTKAAIETRQFLKTVLDAEDEIMWSLVRSLAFQLLRHYPLNADIDLSASTLPGVWTPPPNR